MWGKGEVEFKEIQLKRLDGEPATSTSTAASSAKPPTAELEALRGTWICALSTQDGEAVESYLGVKAVIDGEDLTWYLPEPDGKTRETKSRFRIDPTQSPKHFDWWAVDKPESPDLRVYSLSGNTLRWGTNLDGKTRPESFDAARWQFTMKRVLTTDAARKMEP